MKILMFFVDMMGAEYLNTGNGNFPNGSMDKLLDKLGGCFFDKCYTPAPDTPRSSACMWSGVYPKENGCNNRLKYPGKYLKTEWNLWDSLEKGGYVLNLYLCPSIKRIGLLPYPFEAKVNYENFMDCLRNFQIADNSVTFFYLPDLHYFMDAEGYNYKNCAKGTDIVSKCIDKVFDSFDSDIFDYILFFSDHGFRIGSREHLIDDDRVRTMMFLHKKGDFEVRHDVQIRSNLDIYPTVMDMAGLPINHKIDGKSLLGSGHDYVLVEDHENFSVKLGQTIEHWAVIDKRGKHWLECDSSWGHEQEIENFDNKFYENIVESKLNDYAQNSELWKILHMYDNNKIVTNTYTNGDPVTIRLTNKGIFKEVKWLYYGFKHAVKNRK